MKKFIFLLASVFVVSCGSPSGSKNNLQSDVDQEDPNAITKPYQPYIPEDITDEISPKRLADNYNVNYQRKCDRYQDIFIGPINIRNGAWGVDKVDYWSLCVYGGTWSKDSYMDIGWQWNVKWDRPTGVTTYPSIGFGYHSWCKTTECVNLPKYYLPEKIKNITKLNVDYDVNIQATGTWNLLLNMWISRENNPKTWKAPDHIADEIGWFSDNNNWPRNSGKYFGLQDFGIDGKWHVYKHTNHKCWSNGKCKDFIQFRPHVKDSSRVLHMKIWLDYMLEKGWINKDHYVNNIRLGNETVTGNGITKINRFYVEY